MQKMRSNRNALAVSDHRGRRCCLPREAKGSPKAPMTKRRLDRPAALGQWIYLNPIHTLHSNRGPSQLLINVYSVHDGGELIG